MSISHPLLLFGLLSAAAAVRIGRQVFFIKESKGKKESVPSLLAFTSR